MYARSGDFLSFLRTYAYGCVCVCMYKPNFLGIGLDDTFVMLSAWKHTKPSLSVPDRTAQMFGEAGVSITITSITNVISFVIGAYR